LGQEAVERLVKTIQVFDDFHHANDHIRNTTSARSRPTATRSFSRSTTTTKHYRCIRRTLLILRSPSV
jgi:hypothetical protein